MTTPQTPRLKLNKPTYTKVSDIVEINDNFQKIDDALGGIPAKVNQLDTRVTTAETSLVSVELKISEHDNRLKETESKFNHYYTKSQTEDRIASYNAQDRFIDGGTFDDTYNGNITGIDGGEF